MMRSIPESARAYTRTKTFTETTVPAKILVNHQTGPGVWGLITVVLGQVRYEIRSTDETHILMPGTPGIVEPEVPHRAKPVGEASFFIEFYRQDPD